METSMSKDELQGELKTIELLLEKCYKAMDEIKNGNIIDFKETVDSLYIESVNTTAGTVDSFVKNVIIHLFKLKYGLMIDSYDSLKDEIDNFRDAVDDLVDWYGDRNKNVLNRVNLAKSYRMAVRQFQRILDHPTKGKEYTNVSTKTFPEICPWPLNGIMEYPIERLLNIWDDSFKK